MYILYLFVAPPLNILPIASINECTKVQNPRCLCMCESLKYNARAQMLERHV